MNVQVQCVSSNKFEDKTVRISENIILYLVPIRYLVDV